MRAGSDKSAEDRSEAEAQRIESNRNANSDPGSALNNATQPKSRHLPFKHACALGRDQLEQACPVVLVSLSGRSQRNHIERAMFVLIDWSNFKTDIQCDPFLAAADSTSKWACARASDTSAITITVSNQSSVVALCSSTCSRNRVTLSVNWRLL